MKDVITEQKGNYILVLKLEKSTEQLIPKFGKIKIFAGYFFYCGSAHGSGGVKSRIKRHLEKESKRFWHIDYIKNHMQLIEVWIQTNLENEECKYCHFLANQIQAKTPIIGFGSSDCKNRCKSHLIWFPLSKNIDQLFTDMSRQFDGMSRFFQQIL